MKDFLFNANDNNGMGDYKMSNDKFYECITNLILEKKYSDHYCDIINKNVYTIKINKDIINDDRISDLMLRKYINCIISEIIAIDDIDIKQLIKFKYIKLTGEGFEIIGDKLHQYEKEKQDIVGDKNE